jgi:hypothetical protein
MKNLGAGTATLTPSSGTINGSSNITLTTGNGAILFFDGTNWKAITTGSSGSTSPLTTKGDIWGYSSVDARIPIGSNTTVLKADSAQTLGLKWEAVKDSELSLSDITTNNVTSSQHGFTPKAPADATKFLNGDTTPDYAQVKDSDLSTSDITTNNVSTSKHGFTPKLPNDATKYLDGTGAYTVPAGSGGSGMTELDYVSALTDVTINGSSGSPTNVISSNSVSYNGSTTIIIEFFDATVDSGNGNLVFDLYDGSTNLGRMGQLLHSGGVLIPVHLATRLTPSNASHTYHVKGWVTGSNATAYGAGGYLARFLRIVTKG